jgi:hypothetical protein
VCSGVRSSPTRWPNCPPASPGWPDEIDGGNQIMQARTVQYQNLLEDVGVRIAIIPAADAVPVV